MEYSLLLISVLDADIVKIPTNNQLGKVLSTLELWNKFGNRGQVEMKLCYKSVLIDSKSEV